MKHGILSSLTLLLALSASAQNKKQDDVKAIKAMCGCYEVTFNFDETFTPATKPADYKPSPTKTERGLEWVELVEDSQNKISMQHLLVVSDSMIVKHWRQDWEFESNKLYEFYKDNTWKFKTLPAAQVKGQWTQRVFQVDDSPRYEGSATWVHVDGRHFWTNTTDAPLPRREHTIRNDYNVLKRTNTHEITKEGWIHDQDNVKINRDASGNDVVVANEKGIDVYKKVADSKCAAAQKYWAEYKPMWKNVRDKWASVYGLNKDLSLKPKVEGKSLFSNLFDVKATAPKAETDAIIDTFVIK